MALNRTIDLLPEIFRTDTNRKFLSATLDQLTQEPNIKRTQGFVGRRVGPGVNPADKYVVEPTATRTNYQLEPGVVFLDPNTSTANDAMTYPGMLDALKLQNGDITHQDRLFESEYYSWDPFCDLDKFSNYSQYYWLPSGPLAVNVSTTDVPLTDDITVTRSETSYEFSGTAGKNPVITLARGGNYTFQVQQPGHNFWIQSAPGVDGRLPQTPNISSRDVYGVINNGQDGGAVEFYVPLKNEQDFYYSLPEIAPVDLITDLEFNQLNNIYVSAFLTQNPSGIDGITNLDGKTIVFSNTIINAEQGGWQINTQYDPLIANNTGAIGSFDSTTFDQTIDITVQTQRYSVWKITYVYDSDGNPYITLSSVLNVPTLTKFRILYGNVYSSTQWYKNASGYFTQVPLLTATQDTLYYQDSTNPEIFGEIRLINPGEVYPIDLNEIIGAKTYTSPNGVVFTNGLKVQFRGPTNPAQYQDLEYYVEGVGSGPGINYRVGFVDGEAYFGPWHQVGNQKLTGLANSGTFQQYIYDTVEESILHRGAGGPLGAPFPQTSVIGANQGKGIKLVPVTALVTPETYTKSELIPYDSLEYDIGGFDTSLNAPLIPDYITQNRSSQSYNAWSRSNRWFHIDVITYSAERNGITPVINNDQRAKRPIIEFRENLNLWNMGVQAKDPVNIIDFNETDALSNVNGSLGYGVDGYTFADGTRVIFAADLDPDVRNRIYEVKFIDPTNSGTLIIDLVPVLDGEPLYLQTVVSLNGLTQQGKSFWFTGITWQLAQEKTSVNQAPLFNVYDSNGYSFGDNAVYPSTTFKGNKLFGYALTSSSITDVVLGFPIKYLNLNNVGDIVFQNYFYDESFIYVKNSVSNEINVSNGFVRQYIDRVSFTDQLGWQTAPAKNRSRQVFRFTYANAPLVLDVPVDNNSIYPPVQIYVEGVFVDPTNYSVVIDNNNTIITFTSTLVAGAVIEVQAISNMASAVAFYQVPINLENNALNTNSSQYTLGTIRSHYDSIGQNLRNLVGKINGANNTRDLGNIIPYGTTIVQQSAPLVLPGVYLRDPQFNLFNSLTFNSQEYQKYKALLLDLASRGDFVNLTPTQILDSVTQEIALGKNELFPFYWSDMLPSGETYTEITYTVSPISTSVFETNRIYDFTSSNFQGLSVYLNGTILTRGYDYTVSTDSSTIDISATLAVGDIINIREYSTTYGSFVPNTPTKMGLYPSWKPIIYLDETYVEPKVVIRGHDGSITLAFGDYRDDILLEFETRIFNNLKIVSPVPLTEADVIPGQFRTTEYTLAEINSILLPDFLNWVGWNKLDYNTQTYLAVDPFTYNYRQSSNVLTGTGMPVGAWRGIYNYFYDTITPNTTPWEMLGFSQQPDWWESYYGPAPYTSGNMVLWNDLELGFIADPINPRIDPRYARPGLTTVIPSGSEGALLNPLDCVIGNFDATSFQRSWTFGDDGPVENTWKTSSAWPFAVMRLLALTKPAEFFSLFADRDLYVYDENIGQYLWDGRYRLNASQMAPLYGNGVSKASYNNWIIDYNQQRGVNSSDALTTTLENLDIRLCWRLAGFSDKNYLKIYSERSTPQGQNTSLLLPDESYQILLYQNAPFEQLTYSSVVVQVTDDGWAVYGYNSLASYFEILSSKPSGKNIIVSAGGTQERVSVEYTSNIVRVPYGYVFTSRAAVCDFLFSYGQLLTERGMTFEGLENGIIMNWPQMAQEFLYFSNQGWATGSIINLNPAATKISVTRPGAVVESLTPPRLDNLVLNQNRQVIPQSELDINRFENTFSISTTSSNSINFLNLRFTAFEHMVVIDNRSIFADLIYDPATGARQSRVLVSGWLSGDWNGTVDAPGFVLNQDNIQEWRPNQKYTKGAIVLFKNEYWSASTIIQPSSEFDYSVWLKSDYGQIQKGLLPNAANASDQLARAYSVYDANLEQEVNIFSYGLIGFRPRQYMQALNLDDVSQVNLYQQFLGTAGTRQSTNLFSLANLGKEIAEYNLYEYWAILRSTYGANANRSYFEILLNQALLPSDPSLVQVIQPGQTSKADQTVFVDDLWNTSYKITTPNILPTTTEINPDSALPTAGYANLDDVDVTVFDLEDPTNIDTVLSSVGIGSTIWVAKVNTYDWDVYRVEQVTGQITRVEDNLNDGALVTFDKAHGLEINDMLIIKNFSDTINGVYRVRAVPSIFTVVISYQFTGYETFQEGNGLGLTLLTNRVTQPANIPLLPYADQLLPGIKVWVDNNGDGRWAVLEKTEPFVESITLAAETPVLSSDFGASLAQGLNNLSALVGAPRYITSTAGYTQYNSSTVYAIGDIVSYIGNIYICIDANTGELPTNSNFWQNYNPGAVYSYVRTDKNEYVENSILSIDATGVAGYGNAMDIGDKNWAVVGASKSNEGRGYATTIYVANGSNIFEQRQLLLAPNPEADGGEFGYSVTLSQNERWAFISAPGHNETYAYTRVDVQAQAVEIVTDGSTGSYNYSDYIKIDYTHPLQMSVVLENKLLVYAVDYTLTPTDIVFTLTPGADQLLTLTRKTNVNLDQYVHEEVPGTNVVGTGSDATFVVVNTRGVYQVTVNNAGTGYAENDVISLDQYDIATLDAIPPAPIVTTCSGNSGPTITVVSSSGIEAGMTVDGPGFNSGQYVVSTGPGFVTMNANPDSSPVGSLTFSYAAKVIVTSVGSSGEILTITTNGSGISDTSVFAVDDYLATATNIDAITVTVNGALNRPVLDYTYSSGTLTFNTAPPAGASIIVVSDSHFAYVDTLALNEIDQSSISDALFGHSISSTTSGNQVMIGAPNADGYGAGKSYIFDRNIQRFVVSNDDETVFYPEQSLSSPGYVAVSVNGVYLNNTDLNIGTGFTLGASSVTITAPLAIGDVVEIETNQFTLIQQLESAQPSNDAQFGYKLDQCINDCSLYISSPFDSTILEGAGKVELYRNQSRIYGTITSLVANPILPVNEFIRINNIFVETTGTTVRELVDNINAAGISNVIASTTPDLAFEGDGTTTVLDVGNIYSDATIVAQTVVYLGETFDIATMTLLTPGVDYTYNATTKQITFASAPYNTAKILVVSGRMTIAVKNQEAAQPFNKITVLPGTGTLFDVLDFETYAWQQLIVSPVPQAMSNFGAGLFISDDTLTLLVGAPNGNMIRPTTFDRNTTYFDSTSTKFADSTVESGVVYSYDSLRSVPNTASNPGQFVFGQQFISDAVNSLDHFGAAIDYTTGVLLVGSPGSDFNDSTLADFGQVIQYTNYTQSPAWKTIRLQQPAVDVSLLNTVLIYNMVTNQPLQYFDYFNPLQGKMLGVLEQNIDFIGGIDPAAYNIGTVNNYGQQWAQSQVGKIWWNTSNVRFIDPNQNDIVYASRRWGQLFPGSKVQVYQWIVSDVAPVDYVGPGTPFSTDSYVIASSVNEQGFLVTSYYFWVTGISTVDKTAGKTLGIDAITRYIESPKSSGISYIAPINPSTVAIYNGSPYISAQDTVLHIEYDREKTENAVHVEYQLIGQDRADSFLNPTLYRKFLDSLSGSDTAGNAVPDPLLPPSQKYGVQFRPRQSMVVNRFLALKNYITQTNAVLAQIPITESRPFTLLNSSEPEPSASSGQWNKRVANLEELSYQNLANVDIGYKYLVVSDSSNNGLWTIYEVISGSTFGSKILTLVRVQNYDTRLFWSYVNWYRPGYNPLTRILIEVPNVSALESITVPIGSYVKVTANGQGKFEIYQKTTTSWLRVGLEDGTIELSSKIWNYTDGRYGFDSEVFDAQYYDEAPVQETRKILEAINQELLTGELLIEKNRLLILMFNYILSEQLTPTWLTKTSLIDVDHTIRNLVPYQVYRRDNQDFVLDYINEVKPYHVQIQEFNLKYQGLDQYSGMLTDFDLPAYWDQNQGLFISPVLDNTGTLSTTSSVPSTSQVWSTFPWNQWYNNYLLSIQSVSIVDGGSGYTTPPDIVVTGDCVRQAIMTAQINSAGKVVNINVIDPGEGYTTTAIVTLTGGNGTGAKAVAVMGNLQVRNLLTVMRYDRYQYESSILTWQANVLYPQGTLVRYANQVWQANDTLQTASFDPTEWTIVPASDLSGVDRTMGYYVPTPNLPGLELALLISGVEYPGVQVSAPGFDQDTGFDVGAFDTTPYDNISYGPDGQPSYDPAILDAIYESQFSDSFLGTLPAPAYGGAPQDTRPYGVVVDGGAFVDTYESYAPEELVPGITYDTLDIKVFTTPGADWTGQGHGWPLSEENFDFDPAYPELNFSGLLDYGIVVAVYNQTTSSQLNLGTDYTVDWVNYIVTVINNASAGDVINVQVYGLGGGNQLYTNTYIGSSIGDTVEIPISYDIIDNFAVFNNGAPSTVSYTFEELVPGVTVITFSSEFTSTDRVTITALGTPVASVGSSWSAPVTQYIVSTGATNYTLTNSMSGTNPANAVVTKNGKRARPPEGISYIGTGVTTQYALPTSGKCDLTTVANNDVTVYVNNTPLILGVQFTLDAAISSTERYVTLNSAPALGDTVLVVLRTCAQYWITGNSIVFNTAQGLIPVLGDIFAVTTWNDTAEQNLVTQTFQGPSSYGTLISEGYDDTLYSEGNVNNDPGSFDYSTGVIVQTNSFDLGRVITDPNRLNVTLDGNFLFANNGFTVDGSILTLTGPTINAAQTVVVTSGTNNSVPEAMAFRIFQDMRGLQTVYRITKATTTTVAEPVLSTDDVIYVDDASKLDEPNLSNGIFGIVTINGERIAYRNRDIATNSISGLRRGTAGTGAADHHVGASVYDMGLGNLLLPAYQNYVDQEYFLADGETTTFATENISVDGVDSTELYEAVHVLVGGIPQYSGFTITSAGPVTVEFDTAPLYGYQVTIQVNRGVTWYAPGDGTPSNGVPLQETNTYPARFLRGEDTA